MNFSDFIGKQRKSEPSAVLMMRIIIIIIISSCLIAYIAILINDVNREIPAIKTSKVPVDTLSIPDVLISFDHPFHIYCTFVWYINGYYSRNDSESCMQYITQPNYVDKTYTGYFSLNDQSQYFTPMKSDEEYFESLAIVVIIDDPNFIYRPSFSSVPFAIIFDSENNPIKLSDGTLDLSKTNFSIDENEILINNAFVLTDRMFSLVNFTKHKKLSIIPNWISDIGLSFKHKESLYVNTKFVQGVFVAESEHLSGIKVKPETFINYIETEQISITYLGIIGVIGETYPIDNDEIPDDPYFSIAFFRPSSFIDIIEIDQ
ncbi:6782_t:CDS:2, partial [Funneliformis mosseae]